MGIGKDTKPKDRKGGSSGAKHKKKAKSGLSSQKTKAPAATPNKAWGKDRGSRANKDADDEPTRAARGALKPVKLKLDSEGRDTILDILHQLHVAGMDDGAQDDDTDEIGSESEEEESEEGDAEDSSETDDDGDDDADVDADDKDVGVKGHGDCEYDGSFGDMANLLSGLTVNESDLSGDSDGEARNSTGTMKTGNNQNKTSDEISSETGKSPSTSKRKSTPSRIKGALRSNVTREKLLATMIEEDRKLAKEERRRAPPQGSSSAVIAAAAVGATSVSDKYRRPDAPSGNGSDKVRVEVCAENRKTGAPDLNGKKVPLLQCHARYDWCCSLLYLVCASSSARH